MKAIYISFCLLLTSCITEEKLQKRADQQLAEFQSSSSHKNLLQIAHKEEGAVFTIVHVKQQHYSSMYNKEILRQIKEEENLKKVLGIKEQYYKQILKINSVQKEIYEFLVSSTSEKDFLYVEGRSYPHHYRDAFLKNYIPESILEVNRNLSLKRAYNKPIPDPPYFLGASIFLHQKRKMNVLGAENLALLNLTLSMYQSEKFTAKDIASILAECHEAREDQMIKNMTVNFQDLNYRMSSLRFLVCGSKHDLKNNVKKWNEENPKQKVNLLVFTPSSLSEN